MFVFNFHSFFFCPQQGNIICDIQKTTEIPPSSAYPTDCVTSMENKSLLKDSTLPGVLQWSDSSLSDIRFFIILTNLTIGFHQTYNNSFGFFNQCRPRAWKFCSNTWSYQVCLWHLRREQKLEETVKDALPQMVPYHCRAASHLLRL